MNKTLLQRYVPGALFVIGSLMVLSTRSQMAVPLAGSLATVLPEVEGYRATQQVIPPEELKVVGASGYVARAFWKSDSTVAFTTYVAYYDRQTQGKTMHSPRNCLPGAGWEILSTGRGTITAGGTTHEVNKYLLKKDATQAVVYYWYQGRGRIVASEYAVKWNLLLDAAFRGHTEEALVRIVVLVPGAGKASREDLDAAYAQAEKLGSQVGQQLLSDVSRVLPQGDATLSKTASVGGDLVTMVTP